MLFWLKKGETALSAIDCQICNFKVAFTNYDGYLFIVDGSSNTNNKEDNKINNMLELTDYNKLDLRMKRFFVNPLPNC